MSSSFEKASDQILSYKDDMSTASLQLTASSTQAEHCPADLDASDPRSQDSAAEFDRENPCPLGPVIEYPIANRTFASEYPIINRTSASENPIINCNSANDYPIVNRTSANECLVINRTSANEYPMVNRTSANEYLLSRSDDRNSFPEVNRTSTGNRIFGNLRSRMDTSEDRSGCMDPDGRMENRKYDDTNGKTAAHVIAEQRMMSMKSMGFGEVENRMEESAEEGVAGGGVASDGRRCGKFPATSSTFPAEEDQRQGGSLRMPVKSGGGGEWTDMRSSNVASLNALLWTIQQQQLLQLQLLQQLQQQLLSGVVPNISFLQHPAWLAVSGLAPNAASVASLDAASANRNERPVNGQRARASVPPVKSCAEENVSKENSTGFGFDANHLAANYVKKFQSLE